MTYRFIWKDEALYALVTFVVAFLADFIATGDNPVGDWGVWLVAALVGAARVTAASMVATLTRWLRARNPA